MPRRCARSLPAQTSASPQRSRGILLTCYMTGAEKGRNLGVAGYSHDIVTELFLPLLEQWGEVIPVREPRQNLEAAAADARRRGLEPIHLSILPLQDVWLAQSIANVVVPAWEFPDVPNHEFSGDPQHDWPAKADCCSLVLVGNPFTAKALKSAGVATPIRLVQVPTPDEYFGLPPWQPTNRTTLECSCYVFSRSEASVPLRSARGVSSPPGTGPTTLADFAVLHDSGWSRRERIARNLESVARWVYRRCVRPLLRERVARTVQKAYQIAKSTWRDSGRDFQFAKSPCLELSGIVYTSILNPNDGRKNWQDLLTGFLLALGDREDATLVIKLITDDPDAVSKIVGYYQDRDIPHRCKLAFITAYLSDAEMLHLAEASTYYLQTTRAEGNCLPLMNYLAAGRPGISPRHSAIADYFDEELGFVVDSHPEPAAWPHDPRLRIRTTWQRLVWPSLVEQIRNSYQIAKDRPEIYRALAARGRRKMRDWSSPQLVASRLHAALDLVLPADGDVNTANLRKAA